MRRSIRRATTVVANITTPTMTSRCHSGLPQVARHHVAAVAGDARHELDLQFLCGGELAAVLDHPLDDGSQLGERGIRLLGREGARHRGTMIIRPCARVKGKRSMSTSGA